MFDRNNLIIVFIFLTVFDFFVWRLVLAGEPNKNLEVYFLNVGQGDSELAILPGGVKVLIDAGPDKNILDELNSILPPTDRYIDLVMVSHPQADHFNGLIEVAKRYSVGAFIYNGRDGTAKSWQELKNIVEENKIPAVVLSAGDKINYLESKFDILLPNENFINSKELNDTVLVALLESQGAKILFTGDIGKDIEDYLIDRFDLKVDVLKVAHHGSKYSSSKRFLLEISPKISVIEVGKNSYGHPTKTALDNLALVGSQIFRTDQDGTIRLAVSGGKINIFKKK